MAIPDFQTLMLPVLRASANGEARISEVIDDLADAFALTSDERSELLPSGRQGAFANRVHWARFYLAKGGLIEATRRAHFRITQRGRSVLAGPPERITVRFLAQFPEFQAFRSDPRVNGEDALEPLPLPDLTPDDVMRQAHARLNEELGTQLLARILAAPPDFFERLVVQLLTAMGYGGSLADAGRALGKTGDGGVDGVIDEDALGLDRIYVQAKRYGPSNQVGPGEVRDFFGALDTFKASKGLLVTTSTFTPQAARTAEGLSRRIVLVDGTQLTRLMIRHGVGCRVEETFYFKKLDEEFFEPSS